MNSEHSAPRKLRADVLRNRATLLDTAGQHFSQHGVGTSLDAIAKEAGVGAGTLYRHFPTREALLAAVLHTRSEELAQRQEAAQNISDPAEALRAWLSALETYLNSFSGLPEPLMAAARASEPDNPLTRPCEELMAVTDGFLSAAQQAGYARDEVTGRDLFLATAALAWVRGTAGPDDAALAGLRNLIAGGYEQTSRSKQEKAS